MKFILLQVFLASLLIIHKTRAQAMSEECQVKLKRMDHNVAKILLVYSNTVKPYSSPANVRNEYCQPFTNSWIKEINRFKPCLKNFQRTVFGLLVVNMKKAAKSICSSELELIKAVKHSQCFGPENHKRIYASANKFTIVVESAINSTNSTQMINRLCCGYLGAVDRMSKELNSVCASKSRGTGDFIQHLVRMIASESIEMMCGLYPDINTCSSKSPQVMQEVNKALDQAEPLYSFTPFTSFVKLIAKLDEEVNV